MCCVIVDDGAVRVNYRNDSDFSETSYETCQFFNTRGYSDSIVNSSRGLFLHPEQNLILSQLNERTFYIPLT